MTDLNRASIYVPITSITKADGGRTRIVTGVAASDRLDYDGQRASYDWFKGQLADWFKVGNMREDHRAGGVGKALSLEFDDEKRTATVTSKAIDSNTILKLDEQVLTGYSWGAKSVPGNPIRLRKAADGAEWIESGKIVEVSYVDSPANPDCFVSLVKSLGKKGLQRTKQLGDLDYDGGVTIVQAGETPPSTILKGMLSDIAKRDISAAERDRLGAQGHAIDTGQDHPSYAIANPTDLHNAIQAYGRANPEDRAKLRRHIISEAKRLGRTDMIPDGWKSVGGILAKQGMAGCDCCDDCGPDCAGDCCQECRMMAKAAGPAAILEGVKALEAGEPDAEYKAFLGKVAVAVEGWANDPGVTLDVASAQTLAALNKASAEPDLTKRRVFYSQSNRASVEQAMQNLHEAIGLYMQGAPAADVDKDQRNNTLTGQDAPEPGNTPGGPGTAPEDGVPDDGNMAWDPSLTQDGDPAIRQPDGVRDGRAQGEAGTHTWPPAGDKPGQGPGDQGKGEPPGGKGKPPFDGQQQAPDRSTPRGQDAPNKAAKVERRLAKAKAELAELRKSNGVQPTTPVQVNQTLGQPAAAKRKGSKALRRDVAALTETVRKALEAQPAPVNGPPADEAVARLEKRLRKTAERAQDDSALRTEVAKATVAIEALTARAQPGDAQSVHELRLELAKALGKLERRMAKALASQPAPAPPPDLGPLGTQLAELRKVVDAQQQVLAQRPDGPPQVIDNSLLLANLTKTAFEETRKDLTKVSRKLTSRVKRAERKLAKATAADSKRLAKVAQDVNDLGRRPHPAGPALVGPQEKTFPVNHTIERSLSPALMSDLALYNELSKSADPLVAEGAKQHLRELMERNG